jgi:hypothetical protein
MVIRPDLKWRDYDRLQVLTWLFPHQVKAGNDCIAQRILATDSVLSFWLFDIIVIFVLVIV